MSQNDKGPRKHKGPGNIRGPCRKVNFCVSDTDGHPQCGHIGHLFVGHILGRPGCP